MNDRPPLFARLGLAMVVLLIVSFVGWASVADIEEIARGEGKVIPISRTQIVQSSEAGIIQEIAVQVGQVVSRGDLIVRLDDTTMTSSLGESEARARALKAQIARLQIEELGDMTSPFLCPDDLIDVAPQLCDNEERLLKARRDNIRAKLSVLAERRLQREKELDEVRANIARLEENAVVAKREEALLAPMVERRLVAQTELLRVQRELSDNHGQIQQFGESIIRIQAAISEATLQIQELGLQLQQEALSEKTHALAELSVIGETIRGASDRVARADIRSPVDGVINTLEFNTIGAYVQPGSVVAEIVPSSETLLVEARLSPSDVAFVRAGQQALVKITAFDFSIFGGLDGVVDNVSADSIIDQNTGETYYQVRVRTEEAELERNGTRHPIIPGMIASVDIITGEKTILAYLLKPINKARTEALRER